MGYPFNGWFILKWVIYFFFAPFIYGNVFHTVDGCKIPYQLLGASSPNSGFNHPFGAAGFLPQYFGWIWSSWNGGTPKSSILIGFSLMNQPFWGSPWYPTMEIPIWWTLWAAAGSTVPKSAGKQFAASERRSAWTTSLAVQPWRPGFRQMRAKANKAMIRWTNYGFFPNTSSTH